ncbi:hypothetical protein BDV29DRAFT_183394 [Aspergillus leporis]|uniref:Uncharacterized protein n=1 Tax=Aspergillus leporis TaxID=41062 RepID=A0A5N5WPE3_9EURO|nr:hypothetical protein BDV29DRAFT_183394 [Aspergillus leporis]
MGTSNVTGSLCKLSKVRKLLYRSEAGRLPSAGRYIGICWIFAVVVACRSWSGG